MSYKDDITPGAWDTCYRNFFINRRDTGGNIATTRFDSEKAINEWGVRSEIEANAQLIAEAGTVCNETGMTPRELQQERDEALGALRDIAEGRAYQPVLHASSRLRQIEGGGDE